MIDRSLHGLVEIGTNSVKFLVSKVDSSGKIVHLMDENEVTRIGQGLEETGRLSQEAMEETLSSIERFIEKTSVLGEISFFAVATMALRKASNSDQFILLLNDRTDLSLEILSGEEEANYSLKAVRDTLPKSCSCWLFDTGGGSTEFAYFSGSSMDSPISLDLGALTLTDRFFPEARVAVGSLDDALSWVELKLREGTIISRGPGVSLVGTGGNLVTMASVASGGLPVPHGRSCVLSLEEIQRQVSLFALTDVDKRSLIPGVPESRARIILGGACIVLAVARSTGSSEVRVSTLGLRHGLMKERLSH